MALHPEGDIQKVRPGAMCNSHVAWRHGVFTGQRHGPGSCIDTEYGAPTP